MEIVKTRTESSFSGLVMVTGKARVKHAVGSESHANQVDEYAT